MAGAFMHREAGQRDWGGGRKGGVLSLGLAGRGTRTGVRGVSAGSRWDGDGEKDSGLWGGW